MIMLGTGIIYVYSATSLKSKFFVFLVRQCVLLNISLTTGDEDYRFYSNIDILITHTYICMMCIATKILCLLSIVLWQQFF